MRKWKCVGYLQDHEKNFTIGKIYESIDEKGIKCDDGFDYNWDSSVDEVIKMLSKYYKFEEIIDKKEENNKMLDIKGKKIAVLCDTEEKVKEFYKAFERPIAEGVFECDYPKKLYIGFSYGRLTYDSKDYFKNHDYKLITFDEFMNGKVKKEEKKVNKFKVGDIVKIVGNSNHHGFKIGEKVKLISTYTSDYIDYYSSGIGFNANRLDGTTVTCNIIRDCDITKNSSTLTITTSDSITTLSDGSHTTTINRYYTDKHNEKVAVEEVVKKYYDELSEIDRVSKTPKVGDKVKVVNSGRTYSNYDTWLIENNIDIKCAIKWTNGKPPKNESIYKIVAIHKHLDSKDMLALIEDDYNCYIINIEGLEVIK